MEDVVADDRPLRRAERVDTSHVTEHGPADVVHVVVGERVPLGQAVGITPAPADGQARVIQIGDVVVRDGVVTAVADPDTDGAGEEVPAAADDVVVHSDVVGPLRGVVPHARFADADAPGTEIVDVASLQGAVLTALAEPHAVAPDVAELAIFDRDVPRAVGHHHRVDG